MKDPLKNKKILITGANGYIGRHVTETLLNIGIKVIAVDVEFSEFDERAEKIKTDIFIDPSMVFNRVYDVDACLHLAWRNSFNHYAKSHINNLPLHFNFIEKLIDAGLQQIIVQGSMHEVGYWEGKIDENTPTNPITYYGIGKNALRQAIAILASQNNMTFQWIRAFYITGDDSRNHSVFTKILQAESENKAVFPFTSGKNKYDFISIEELAKQISYVILQRDISGIINCCSGEAVPLRQAVEDFIKKNKLNIKPEFGAFQKRPYDSPSIWGDNAKIQKIIAESQYDL